MSLATCPSCGAQYIATVRSCADCGVALVRPDSVMAAFTGNGAGAGVDVITGDLEVVYDLEDWTPEQRQELSITLAAEGVAHRWDVDELVVGETGADRAEALIDAIDHPDALDEEDDGDDASADVLSALYVASDVLQRDPRNSRSIVQLLEASSAASGVGLPFGIDRDTWGDLIGRAETLADLLAAGADDDEVVAAARSLRNLVRDLV